MSARAAILIALGVFGSACGLTLGDNDSALYDGPWPDERLRREDGTVDVSAFPRGTGVPLRDQLLHALDRAPGFGLASAVYVPMHDEIDEASLPSVEESIEPFASVALVDVDERSPELGRRMPIDVRFGAEPRPFAPARILSVLPHPGLTLRPDTLYACVVTTRVRERDGRALAPSEQVAALSEGRSVDALSEHANDAHREAIARLQVLGVSAGSIADLAVFRTGPDPVQVLRADLDDVLLREEALMLEPRLIEEHADYCVYESSVLMPVYQTGRPPYLFEGGEWLRDTDGRLALQRRERARVLITVPRIESVEPLPTAVLIRTGAGGDRPLIDRGPRGLDGRSTPGTGLAVHFARAGFAGVSVDGPLGGVRNVAGWDEQFAVFNVLNMQALRDNVRQSALELALVAHMLEHVEVNAGACAGASARVRLRSYRLALVGHSMGATIAPLVASVEPRYGAMILSGAGASWIRQIIYKRSPLPTRDIGELMLGYSLHHYPLSEHDPMLNLLQWGGDVADPQLYARGLMERASPPHVLVFQGLLDTYIPPPVANPLNLSLALDVAGDSLDEAYAQYRPYLAAEALGERAQLSYPVRGNGAGGITRAVVHHAEDGIEDGHEVLFQLPGAQRQLRCFLESFARETPVVVAPGDPAAPCEIPL